MADDFVPSVPMITLTMIGPNGKEYYNGFLKNADKFTEEEVELIRKLLKRAWLGGKDDRENYWNVNGFVSREERLARKQSNQPQSDPIQKPSW